MLEYSALSAAGDLTEIMVAGGRIVSPKSGTYLTKLNRALLGAGLGNLTGVLGESAEGDFSIDRHWLQQVVDYSVNGEVDGSVNEHTVLMDELAVRIAAITGSTMAFARNVVNPLVKDIVEKSAEALNTMVSGARVQPYSGGLSFATVDGSLSIDIQQSGPAPIFLDSDMDQWLSARVNVGFKDLPSPNIYPEMSSAEIFEFVSKNVKAPFAKTLIADLEKADSGFDLLSSVYNYVYKAPANGQNTGTHIALFRGALDMHFAVVLLIADALAQAIPDNTRASASTAETAISNWVQHLKKTADFNLQSYKTALAEKKLVLSSHIEAFKVTLVVQREMYDSFLEDGGSVEALIGAHLGDRNFDYDNLINKNATYLGLYEKRCSEAAQFALNNRLSIFKNSVNALVIEAIDHPEEDAPRPTAKSESRKLLKEQMKHTYTNALECPFDTVRRIVCRSMFAETDAEEILTNIEALCAKREEADIREISAAVMVDYIAKYMVSQMDVQSALTHGTARMRTNTKLETVSTFANAIQLVKAVFNHISGSEISSLDHTDDALESLIAASINKHLSGC